MRVVHGCKQSGAVLGLLTCLATSTALAQMRQASSHEHGRSSMNIVLEDRIVAVEVMGPMANFVGFEHAPSSDQEREAVAGARATLEMPTKSSGIGSSRKLHCPVHPDRPAGYG